MNYYIYRFLNKDEILYVGKTTDITRRMYIHFNKGHLPLDCYDRVETIQYIECKNNTEMNLKEIYFINKYKPMYNSLLKNESDEITLKEFDDIPWIKEYKIEKHNNVDNHYEKVINDLESKIKHWYDEYIDINIKYTKLLDKHSRHEYLMNSYKELLMNTNGSNVGIIANKIKLIEKDPYWYNKKS